MERIEYIFDRSLYITGKEYISLDKTEEYKYKVIHSMPIKGIRLCYSNKDLGHFGIPKLIISRASTYTLLDIKGEYGIGTFGFAIIDTVDNLYRIQKVIDSPELQTISHILIGNLHRNAACDGIGTMFKFMKEFRRDFWKEFYTFDMEQELIKEGKIG